jgi:hypothetical protein
MTLIVILTLLLSWHIWTRVRVSARAEYAARARRRAFNNSVTNRKLSR